MNSHPKPMETEIYISREFGRQFKKLFKKYHSLLDDLNDFKKSILGNPFQGSDLGHGVRKIRFPISDKGKGKSGGARVITLNISKSTDTLKVTLLTIYDKSEISNVSDKYIKSLVEAEKK